MKLVTQNKAFALVLTLGLVAGCSSTGETVSEEEQDGAYGSDVSAVDQEGGSTVYDGDEDGGVSSRQLSEAEQREREARAEAEQAEKMGLRDVTTFYFDFDTAEIKPESREVLVAHARFLKVNPSQEVRLEGSADERGTKEYNLALGERRANAVERFLVVNGASRDQIETVSYGEEKPAVMGSGESVWSQNRRVELLFE
ncbi:MAG: peptidoglycan-associated lipoprotein Pal [Oleiphilaceae bacterium]|nr:peptidoglycan-associated lipoprotein Pal [Oleiphilaceae bacterium]